MALIGILLAAFWLAALALCIQLMLRTKSKTRRRHRPRRKSPSYSPSPLENELINLLNGDSRAAQRLISSTRRRHPNQSEQWCQEKVLYDLERDRR